MLTRLILLFTLVALPLKAEEVVLGLSSDKVAITATFEGSELLVFGAVKREAPIADEPLDVIVAIAGPSETLTVRRKEKRYGIWVNIEAAELTGVIDNAEAREGVVATADDVAPLDHGRQSAAVLGELDSSATVTFTLGGIRAAVFIAAVAAAGTGEQRQSEQHGE